MNFKLENKFVNNKINLREQINKVNKSSIIYHQILEEKKEIKNECIKKRERNEEKRKRRIRHRSSWCLVALS